MLRTNDVDVAEAMQRAAEDVLIQARDKHATDLATYREGVRRMAAGGGRLPPEEAERLLAACRSLGVPPERLSVDVGFVLQHDGLAAEMEAIRVRNAAKQEPIPRLEAEATEAGRHWSAVRNECEGRLREAESRLTQARLAVERALRVPMEKTDQKEREMRRVEGAAPHVFHDVEPGQLRRIIDPDRRSVFG
jgi:hypothetical protein